MTSTMAGLMTDFDFNLPHGTEEDDLSANIVTHAGVSQDTNNDHPLEQHTRTNDNSMDDLFDDPKPKDTTVNHDGDDSQQPVNYEQLALDFSEDEGIEQAFDRSWSAHLARKPPSRKKKSPRRSQDSDGDDAASPRMKKPRQSLFGGPVEDSGVDERNEDDDDQNGNAHASEVARPDLRHHMSSLNLDQDGFEDENDQDDAPVDLSFGLGAFDRDSISPASSRAPSEGSFVRPPDNQVSM
jgi:hypothetical protein